MGGRCSPCGFVNHAGEKMPVLERIAQSQGRRDEASNQELARDMVEHENRDGIRGLVANLWHANQYVRSDCLKTLYEIGYLKPDLPPQVHSAAQACCRFTPHVSTAPCS